MRLLLLTSECNGLAVGSPLLPDTLAEGDADGDAAARYRGECAACRL
jgi:hypothetical protein